MCDEFNDVPESELYYTLSDASKNKKLANIEKPHTLSGVVARSVSDRKQHKTKKERR